MMKRCGLAILLLSATDCKTAGTPTNATVKDLSGTSDTPADPAHPFTNAQAVNFSLYKNESYKFNSQSDEIGEFWNIASTVKQMQLQNAPANKSTKRGFHAKEHGCLVGHLQLRSDRPANGRAGIFADGGRSCYNVLVRFSNGVGTIGHDLKPDVRGVGLKIFGTDLGGKERKSMDILFTNSPSPFGTDTKAFVAFGNAQVNAGPLGVNFLHFLRTNGESDQLTHESLTRKILDVVPRHIKSLTYETFWSGHPYLMGPDQAVKFNIKPVNPADRNTDAQMSDLDMVAQTVAADTDALFQSLNRNYLRKDLADKASAGPIQYTLNAQFDTNSPLTPIEDDLTEWREQDAPSQPLADLVIDQQDFDNPNQDALCDGLSFTPGRFNSQHRPLSNMGRGRIFAYEASAQYRQAALVDPDESAIFPNSPCTTPSSTSSPQATDPSQGADQSAQ